MKVEIYESSQNRGRYFLVAAGSATSPLPEKIDPTKKKIIELQEGKQRIGLSETEAIGDIKKNGYHVTNIAIRFDETT